MMATIVEIDNKRENPHHKLKITHLRSQVLDGVVVIQLESYEKSARPQLMFSSPLLRLHPVDSPA